MTDSTDAPLAEPIRYEDEEKYLVRGEHAIRQIMQSLIDKRVLVRGCAMPRNHTFPTSMVEVLEDEDAVLIDGSASETINRSIEEATHVTCVSRLDRIHVQFRLQGLTRVMQGGQIAFRADLPESVLRLQRREFYRLQTPISEGVSCTLALPRVDGSRREAELRILDISGGGVAIAVPPVGVHFEPGTEFPDSLLRLPDTAPISARLVVRNLFRITRRGGAEVLRAGCEFADLPRGAEDAIQRYILRAERTRNARERGRL